MEQPSRRAFLRIASVTAGASVLAGCSGGSGGGGGGDGDDQSDDDAATTSASDDGGGGSGTSRMTTVEMTDSLKYAPKKIEVEAGTTVVWENTGAVGHTITAYEEKIPDGASYFASGGFDSQSAAEEGYKNQEGNVAEGETYEHTFETEGTYEYYCIPHEMNEMVGTVEVV